MDKYRYWERETSQLEDDYILRFLKTRLTFIHTPLLESMYKYLYEQRLTSPKESWVKWGHDEETSYPFVWSLLPAFAIEYGATYDELYVIAANKRPKRLPLTNYASDSELADYEVTSLHYYEKYGVDYPKPANMRQQSELAKALYKHTRKRLKRLSAIVNHPKYGSVRFVTIQR